jgi:hypothetical protein
MMIDSKRPSVGIVSRGVSAELSERTHEAIRFYKTASLSLQEEKAMSIRLTLIAAAAITTLLG